MRKRIPKFKTEDQEQQFWASHNSTDYLEWNKGKRMVLPELKPSVVSISIRLPESMLEELKLLANKTDIPYQSLMKMFLSERLHEEFVSKRLGKKNTHGHRSDLAA